jgi:hypothetical protein
MTKIPKMLSDQEVGFVNTEHVQNNESPVLCVVNEKIIPAAIAMHANKCISFFK